MNGFSNILSLKDINEISIQDVENFVRNDLPLILQNKCHQENVPFCESIAINFFGSFNRNTSSFRFSSEEVSLIRKLADQINEIILSDGLDSALEYFHDRHSNDCSDDAGNVWFFQDISTNNNPVDIDIDSINKTIFEFVPDDDICTNTRTHYVLNKLLETAKQNSLRPKQGYRFDNEVKNWSSYIRMRAGPMAYNDIQRNLEGALPALSSTNRYIRRSNQSIVEGVLRCEELLLYLTERKLPLAVTLSEDATRIVGRVQYDSSTNLMVGFVLPINNSNGMPTPYVFKARSTAEIVKLFINNNGKTAKFVNTIIAQPLADVPPFCLIIFGSDNKYTSENVSKRWMYIVNELKKLNISVVTISSDSDPKYNAAMRLNSGIGHPSEILKFNWFSCSSDLSGPFFIQDPTHIATKMRNFLLKTIRKPHKLPFGPKYFISNSHLERLLHSLGKDEHQLTATVLNPTDRQNFSSALRICDKNTTDLLEKYIKGSDATTMFLIIMRNYIDAYMNRELSPIERIEKVWYSVFIIRIWRRYILINKKLTLSENFLSSNCYSCLEINAHGLVLILLGLREQNAAQFFQPHHFSSQPCEGFYRQIRSFTSTYSTVANCTVKEILGRIHKIQLQNDISDSESKTFVFPKKYVVPAAHETKTPFEIPHPNEIIECIEKCRTKAVKDALTIGLIKKRDINCELKSGVVPGKPKDKWINDSDEDDDRESKCSKEISKFMFVLQSTKLKNFAEKKSSENISENSPFVLVPYAKKRIVLKKTTLAWYLSENAPKLSSDRLLRVQTFARKKMKKRKRIFSGIRSIK